MEPMEQVERRDELYAAGGYKVYATNNSDLNIMEWESGDACRLARLIHRLMRKHALFTTYHDDLGHRSVLVKAIERLPVTVRVESSGSDTKLQLLAPGGETLTEEEALGYTAVTKSRMEMLTDCATHAARSLRAHLAPFEIPGVILNLTFGVGPAGDCLMQVIDPVSCDLGSTDYATLYIQLGGDEK